MLKQYGGTVGTAAVGMFEGGAGWAIPIGHPQSLMVTVGGIGVKPGVVDGDIAIRDYLSLTISFDRAGWYAFDRFDNDNIPSAEEIIPALQHLDLGQVIGEEGFAVQAIEPNRLLLLAFHYPKTEWVVKQGFWPKFGECSWAILLDPIDGEQRTRLILRFRFGCRLGLAVLYYPLFELADCLSERKMLLGIKQRAERSRWQTPEAARAVTPH